MNDQHNGNHRTNKNPNGNYNGYRPNAPVSKPDTNDDEIDLKHILFTGWRYKYFIALCLIAGTVAAFLIAKSITPIYKAESRLIIAEMQYRYSMAGSDLANLLTSSFGIGMGSTIANELQVLSSRRFVEQVAEQFINEPLDRDGNLWPLLQPPDDEKDYTAEEIRKLAIERLLRGIQYERVDREADVINISFESTSPEEAKLVVNRVMDTYSNFSTFENRQQSRAALAFLERELGQIEENLQKSEEKMRDFMNTEGLVMLDEQSRKLVEVLATLDSELGTVNVRLGAAISAREKLTEELESLRPGLVNQISRAYGSNFQRLQFKKAELETERLLLIIQNPELAVEGNREPRLLTIDNQIRTIEEEIRKLTQEIISQDERFLSLLGGEDGNLSRIITDLRKALLEITVEEQQLISQKELLEGRIAELDVQFISLPDNMVRFGRYRRDVLMNEQLYLTVAKQASELMVWEQTQLGYGRVVDYAIEPIRPVKPRRMIFLLGGFMLGGILSLIVITFRELMHTEINSVEVLRERPYPILSVIPNMSPIIKDAFKGANKIKVHDKDISTDLIAALDPISPASESFRRLFNNIVYAEPDNPYKTIIITSSGQGEGKSASLMNLAAVIAESGQTAIVVDCDFRRPRVHKAFGLAASPGLTELVFNEKDFSETIRNTFIPGLDAITTGRMVNNPVTIVQSRKMTALLKELGEMYDYVLIDAPPYGIITDAAPLMKACDGVILAVRFDKTKKADLDFTIENLRNINVPVIGTLFTFFDHKKASGYHYSNNYYRYAYKQYGQYVETRDRA